MSVVLRSNVVPCPHPTTERRPASVIAALHPAITTTTPTHHPGTRPKHVFLPSSSYVHRIYAYQRYTSYLRVRWMTSKVPALASRLFRVSRCRVARYQTRAKETSTKRPTPECGKPVKNAAEKKKPIPPNATVSSAIPNSRKEKEKTATVVDDSSRWPCIDNAQIHAQCRCIPSQLRIRRRHKNLFPLPSISPPHRHIVRRRVASSILGSCSGASTRTTIAEKQQPPPCCIESTTSQKIPPIPSSVPPRKKKMPTASKGRSPPFT
ncbi:hypothetical protein EJ06DRAFT_415456 [Trichodelitschia bisporula]|uniref:Uncharacterized protein n=1 Tax=Trichodelitschia bisporula TaxID=703511 RepID=A0A6G1HYF7_9PEZI|nr:hypothetical protein EJ06DRAFT_415456 [Trichodelitschia bisporula]